MRSNTSILGFLLAILILWRGVIGPSARPAMFLDTHALLLVFGGTLAATLIAFPLERIVSLGRLFLWGMLLKKQPSRIEHVNELVSASTASSLEGPGALTRRTPTHPFMAEGYSLLAEAYLNEAQFQEVLTLRSTYFRQAYINDAKTLTALSKFPPAFGLLGATTGMISMMSSLGSGDSGAANMGPAMAVALVATFWGIAIANLILLPMADYANKAAQDDALTRRLISDGLVLIQRGESPAIVNEVLNSHLAVLDRRQNDMHPWKRIQQMNLKSKFNPPQDRNRAA